jgi:hypothetical protein
VIEWKEDESGGGGECGSYSNSMSGNLY